MAAFPPGAAPALPGLSFSFDTPFPGAGAGDQSGATAGIGTAGTSSRNISLPAGSELRFESSATSAFQVTLRSGQAEVFGTELAPGRTYSFGGADGAAAAAPQPSAAELGGAASAAEAGSAATSQASERGARSAPPKAAVYTWRGCDLRVEGAAESEYVAQDTEMWSRLNLHFALENLRIGAAAAAAAAAASTTAGQAGAGTGIGPRVLVLGPQDSGKTSLVKTLTGYAVRMDRHPVVVNLDPSEGVLAPPGTLSAAQFVGPLAVEEENGWGSSPVTGPSAVSVHTPVLYSFGQPDLDDCPRLYKALVARLALAVTTKFEASARSKAAGCIIDTPGSLLAANRLDLISHIISEFSVNIVLTIGSERLYNDLVRKYPGPRPGEDQHPADAVAVYKIAKSEGTVARSAAYRKQTAVSQIRSYFFGSPTAPLTPSSTAVDFPSLAIYRLAASVRAANGAANPSPPGSADPGSLSFADAGGDDGASAAAAGPLYERVQPSSEMLNTVVAVLYSPNSLKREEEIRDSSVAGYVYITAIDEIKQRLTVLAPNRGRIPPGVWVWGTLPGKIDMLTE